MKKYITAFLFLLFAVASVYGQTKTTNPKLSKLYQNYITVKSALASDDADKSSKAAKEFLKTASEIEAKHVPVRNLNILKKNAAAIAEAKTISVQRENFFSLSDIMIALAKDFKLSENPVYIQYCPMAEGSWLSNESKIVNPYYGKSMLSCGNVKNTIK